MRSTVMERPIPHRHQQRTLQFSLLFGASGGVACGISRSPSLEIDRPAHAVAVQPRQLNDHRSHRDRDSVGFAAGLAMRKHGESGP